MVSVGLVTENNKIELRLIESDELSLRRHKLTAKVVTSGKRSPNELLQREYANLLVSSKIGKFLHYYDSITKSDTTINVDLPTAVQKLTGKEVSEPPLSTEKNHYTRLSNLPPRIAAMPAFWTSYQIEMIRFKLIEPANLAGQAGSTDSGRARLEKAMKSSNMKLLDDCVRTVLRQLGGLPEVRGNISLFVDCKIARAWWRGHISECASNDMGLDLDTVWNLLRLSTAPWEAMILFGLRRLTTVSDRSVRSAFIARLIELEIHKLSSKDRKKTVEELMKQIGVIGANRALGYLTPNENLSLIKRASSH